MVGSTPLTPLKNYHTEQRIRSNYRYQAPPLGPKPKRPPHLHWTSHEHALMMKGFLKCSHENQFRFRCVQHPSLTCINHAGATASPRAGESSPPHPPPPPSPPLQPSCPFRLRMLLIFLAHRSARHCIVSLIAPTRSLIFSLRICLW
jgi:hypothetical protein